VYRFFSAVRVVGITVCLCSVSVSSCSSCIVVMWLNGSERPIMSRSADAQQLQRSKLQCCRPARVEQFTAAPATRHELCAFQASTENISTWELVNHGALWLFAVLHLRNTLTYLLTYVPLRNYSFTHCVALWYSAVHKILTKARQLVDVKKDDGFAALHLAALNGHLRTAETLIDVVRHLLLSLSLHTTLGLCFSFNCLFSRLTLALGSRDIKGGCVQLSLMPWSVQKLLISGGVRIFRILRSRIFMCCRGVVPNYSCSHLCLKELHLQIAFYQVLCFDLVDVNCWKGCSLVRGISW